MTHPTSSTWSACLIGGALAVFLGPGACADEPIGGVEASVARAQLDVDPGRPDALANLDLTVDLEAHEKPVEVRLRSVSITQQPVVDGSERLVFSAELVSTQGDEPVVRLAAGDTGVVRVLNAGTLNAELEPWCRRPVELVVTLVTDADDEAEATQDISVRCP